MGLEEVLFVHEDEVVRVQMFKTEIFDYCMEMDYYAVKVGDKYHLQPKNWLYPREPLVIKNRIQLE
jgi:hypothetical protein